MKIGALFLCLAALAATSSAQAVQPMQVDGEIAAIERRTGGRLGVMLIDDRGKVVLSHHSEQRFAMCSAFKLPLAGAALKAIEAGEQRSDLVLRFTKPDLLSHSPVMERRLRGNEGRTTLMDALQATVETSDNLAANLILARIGGPAGLTRRLRAMGDLTTRSDRTELGLNQNLPGDKRDTSSPRAMAATTRTMLFGKVLTPRSRNLLLRWTNASETGLKRVRAGLPVGWTAGDKTGTCSGERGPHPQYNDIGWFVTPSGKRFVFAVMLDHPTVGSDKSEAAIAAVGALAATAAR